MVFTHVNSLHLSLQKTHAGMVKSHILFTCTCSSTLNTVGLSKPILCPYNQNIDLVKDMCFQDLFPV